MGKFITSVVTLAFALTVVTASAAFAATRPVESLNDLPSKWTGVAGGLLQSKNATFSIDKVVGVSRDDRADGFTASYDVEATMMLGKRKLNVTKIQLECPARGANRYEFMMTTDDELVPHLLAIVRYDEASNSFSLKELPHYGERRFSLSAPARPATSAEKR